MAAQHERESWGSRFGLIMAMAGNAIGLGNFLRFPVQAARNGGGAFMIPYFIAFLVLGIPMMWVEWSIGRFGGKHGHGTMPGMLHRLWGHPAAKYIGVLGIALPAAFAIYYSYVQSWTLAYSFFSFTGQYLTTPPEDMGIFVNSFKGQEVSPYFSSIWTAYAFFVLNTAIVVWVMARGVVHGIERLAKVAMPLLFLFAITLVIRVFTLGTPDPAYPDRSVVNGMGFIWNPNFSRLTDGDVWLAAAGQIFFTIGIGIGSMQTYASYLKAKEDLALSGLTTAMANEFAEVILGGSIAIPVAVAFFGLADTQAIAQGDPYDLGFQTMPLIFQKLPLGQLFGTLWFLLLFFAGITSTVALTQTTMAFLQDELRMTRVKAALIIGLILFVGGQYFVFFYGHGVLGEMDFWVGTLGLVVFSFLEIAIFVWAFGMDNGWQELTEGAAIRVPRVFYYIIKYLTPLTLLGLLVAWSYQSGLDIILLRSVPPDDVPYRWGARLLILSLLVVGVILVRQAWRQKSRDE